MGLLSRLGLSNTGTVGPDANPGDPDGVEFVDFEPSFSGNRAAVVPSPWSGWPSEWGVPNWDQGRFDNLVDTAWACVDLNAKVLSTMPVYIVRNGEIKGGTQPSWLRNPDPSIYTSWHEFAKQLFWDFQLGEAFVMPTDWDALGFPSRFRVIPPHLVNAELIDGRRRYNIGAVDVTEDILHIRYKSSTDGARGVGPLESGRNRVIAAGVLERYATELAMGGGIPYYALTVQRRLSKTEADDLLEQWWQSRRDNLGKPAILSGGVDAKQLQLSPQDMALLDLAQFNEARIAVDLGVPPFLVGLPTPDSMTYSNVSQIFDFHDRASLRSLATHVMAALSGWLLPRRQALEMNRDEYSRPAFNERTGAYVQLVQNGILSPDEVRTMERFTGEAPAQALTGVEEQ